MLVQLLLDGAGVTLKLTFLEMVKPRPVPPNRLAVDESACEKGRKSFLRTSSSMPMPVSKWVISTTLTKLVILHDQQGGQHGGVCRFGGLVCNA